MSYDNLKDVNYRALSDDLTELVVTALQHFDYIDKKGPPQTLRETAESISGGIKRYQCDPVFRAKVYMLVSRIMATVRRHHEL